MERVLASEMYNYEDDSALLVSYDFLFKSIFSTYCSLVRFLVLNIHWLDF